MMPTPIPHQASRAKVEALNQATKSTTAKLSYQLLTTATKSISQHKLNLPMILHVCCSTLHFQSQTVNRKYI